MGQRLGVVQSFGGQPVYGWEFFDIHKRELSRWGRHLSLNWQSGTDGLARSICVFQCSEAEPVQHLDLCVWFDELEVRRPDGSLVPLEEFAAGGRRWWNAFYAGDQRSEGHGIFPV